MLATLEEERQGIEATAVRKGRHVKLDVARAKEIDIRQVGQAHGKQGAMAQHRALWPAGRATGVEEPGQILGPGSVRCDGPALEEAFVGRRAGADDL